MFLASVLGWDHVRVGTFLAVWVIGYGLVQALAPRFTHRPGRTMPGGARASMWAAALAVIPAGIALALAAGAPPGPVLVIGLAAFGVLFAINSALHSYLIVSHARGDGVSLDVGFYYMANAMGRLLGTVLSGWVYQVAGLEACLWISAVLVAMAAVLARAMPSVERPSGVVP